MDLLIVVSYQQMKVKGDDDHRPALPVNAGEGRDKIKTQLNHAVLEGRKGGVKCVVRK